MDSRLAIVSTIPPCLCCKTLTSFGVRPSSIASASACSVTNNSSFAILITSLFSAMSAAISATPRLGAGLAGGSVGGGGAPAGGSVGGGGTSPSLILLVSSATCALVSAGPAPILSASGTPPLRVPVYLSICNSALPASLPKAAIKVAILLAAALGSLAITVATSASERSPLALESLIYCSAASLICPCLSENSASVRPSSLATIALTVPISTLPALSNVLAPLSKAPGPPIGSICASKFNTAIAFTAEGGILDTTFAGSLAAIGAINIANVNGCVYSDSGMLPMIAPTEPTMPPIIVLVNCLPLPNEPL